METPNTHHEVLIVGGGSAGISVASRLLLADNPPAVTILDPAEKHYYQPLWTLVGGGVVPKEESERTEASVIPTGATWIQDAATSFDPDNNTVTTEQNGALTYDYLVVCPGIQINWDSIEGLKEGLGTNGICCNYSYEHCDYTWETAQRIAEKPGPVTALFTQPSSPVKCGGAPQKVMYLTSDHLRRSGKLDQADVEFFSPGQVIFGVQEFAKTLHEVLDRYGIETNWGHELVAIRPDTQEAVFQVSGGDGAPSEKVVKFDMLHAVPHMASPDFLAKSPLANEAGWCDVDKHTLQHVRYANVFGLGDAGSTPNAKTGAAIRKQYPVVAENLLAVRAGRTDLSDDYHGYASCPLVTGYGRLILAEFDYDGNVDSSFPFDTTKERYSMYVLKKDLLPNLYWHGMLQGRA
ncbi:MAG: FAD/NAD(P)-binding oxidoreductase [Sandaracinaceae bacterium]